MTVLEAVLGSRRGEGEIERGDVPQLGEVRGESGSAGRGALSVDAAVTARCPGPSERGGDGLGRNLGRTRICGRKGLIRGVIESTRDGGEGTRGEGRRGWLLEFCIQTERGGARNLLRRELAVKLLLLLLMTEPRAVIRMRRVRDGDRIPHPARERATRIRGRVASTAAAAAVARMHLVRSHLHSCAESNVECAKCDSQLSNWRKTMQQRNNRHVVQT